MSKFKNIALSFIVLIVLSTTVNAKNAPANLPLTTPVAEPITVKYLGDEGDYLVFEVTVQPGDAKKASFEVSDKTEGALYSSSIRSGKVQTMKIEKRINQQLNFKLVIGNAVYSKSFAILEPIALATK